MRQFVGIIVIFFSLIALVALSQLVLSETGTITIYQEKMASSVNLSTVDSIKPLTLVDRNGNVFSEEYIEWRQPLAFDEIPKIVKDIFMYSEDEHFYEHIGFDVSAIARAIVANSAENSSQQGGSTITQQLVRMRYLSAEKTYERKLTELFYAYELEKNFTKEKIFEMYLNESYFGNQVYGIGSAATFYFSKPIHELSIAEAAFIAAIPNNPSLYDPFVHFENTKERQERLLDKLAEHKIISASECETLKQTPITLKVKKKTQQAPAYTDYVLEELKQLIATQEQLKSDAKLDAQKVKEQIEIRYNQLQKSGATIYTALDPVKQANDEEQLNTILARYPFQGSAAVIENETREIVSIYPGKNYKKFDLNRAYQTYRQPGSAFKPIAAFAPFINETGYGSNYIVSGGKYCVENYCPSNYGGGIYGDVTLSTSFKFSYNTSALRLIHRIGLEKSFSYINQFDFAKIGADDFNYASALGGLHIGVSSVELAGAYTSFIDGSYKRPRAIRSVVDAEGQTIYSWSQQSNQIWSPKTTSTLRSLLQDVVESGTAKNLHYLRGYVGAKTGTTNNYNDFWIAGLNDQYTTAVWIGYDTPASLEKYEKQQVHFDMFHALLKD